jgi:hypothetical protein
MVCIFGCDYHLGMSSKNGENLKKGESAMGHCVGGLSGLSLRRKALSGFHGQTAQFVSVVTQNLPRMAGELMQKWIQDPQSLQKTLHRAFSEFPPRFDFKMPNVWGIITIDNDEFDLVIVTLYEFGSDLVVPTVSAIGHCARKNGLELCSAQVAKELESGKGYAQPQGEKLFICVDDMDPSNNKLYCLESGKLAMVEAVDQDGWNSGCNLHGCEQFVFVRPRK